MYFSQNLRSSALSLSHSLTKLYLIHQIMCERVWRKFHSRTLGEPHDWSQTPVHGELALEVEILCQTKQHLKVAKQSSSLKSIVLLLLFVFSFFYVV